MKYLYLLLFFLLAGCVTRATVRNWEKNLFSLKKKVLNIEHSVDLANKQSANKANSDNKKLSSTQQRLDTLENKLQNIMGLIDALKVGVITGRYPGLDSESESVAGAITELQSQVESLEQTQETILKEFKTLLSVYNKKKYVKQNKKRKKITNFAALKKAFVQKRFRHVFEDAKSVVSTAKNKNDKAESLYMLAESTFKLGKIRDAALHFNELLDLNAQGRYTETAKVRLGDCFRYLGDIATAKLFYQDLVDNHPNSAEANKATEKLKALQGK